MFEMYPDAFHPHLGILPSHVAIAVTVELHFPEQAALAVPYLVAELSIAALQSHVKILDDQKAADTAQRSVPKMGMSRNDRRLFAKNDPVLFQSMQVPTP